MNIYGTLKKKKLRDHYHPSFSSTPKISKLGDTFSNNKSLSDPNQVKNQLVVDGLLPKILKNPKKSKNGTIPSIQKILSLTNVRERDQMIQKYRYLIKSPNIPNDRVKYYIILVIRGLHYSINCLKSPSQKFLNLRKIRLKDARPRKNILIYPF